MNHQGRNINLPIHLLSLRVLRLRSVKHLLWLIDGGSQLMDHHNSPYLMSRLNSIAPYHHQSTNNYHSVCELFMCIYEYIYIYIKIHGCAFFSTALQDQVCQIKIKESGKKRYTSPRSLMDSQSTLIYPKENPATPKVNLVLGI